MAAVGEGAYELRSLAIDFAEFPAQAARDVLRIIKLPIDAGMTIGELRERLGEPLQEYRYIRDRVTYEFVISEPAGYDVSCTVLDEGGLMYLVVMASGWMDKG